MERFRRRFEFAFRKVVCRKQRYNLAKYHPRSNIRMANLKTSNEEINWEEQGKPLVESNGITQQLSSNLDDPTTDDMTIIDLSTVNKKAHFSELPRFIVSYLYMFIFGLANCFVVVIAHDWTPDRTRYLPLPDLILNNVPYFPWAFRACEALGLTLLIIFAIHMSVHKHRFVILRRLFIIYGTVLLMRCPTLILTSLSIPSQHLQCEPTLNDTLQSKFQRAVIVYSKMGLSSQGVMTCGDYMFSGHTVFIALLNFTITEYSSIVLLHVFTWLITLAAMFFILLGEAHYSIDVLIAFFLSALYFNYYHTLVNHHNPQNESSLHTPPSSWLRRLCFVRQRLRIWVPFYSYLERGTGGAPLPHEFESPLTALLRFVRGVRHRVKFGKSRLI